MSKSNARAKKELEKIFGKGCFIERMGLREIKGYKKMDRMITYHHIREKSKGGKATVENGANLAWENHQWLHSLPPKEKAFVNNKLQAWKFAYLQMNGKGDFGVSGTVDPRIDFSDLNEGKDYISIPLEDTTEQDRDDLIKYKQKFNRSKVKRQVQKYIDEILYEEDEEEYER